MDILERFARRWTIQDSQTLWCENFITPQDRPRIPPTLLCDKYRVSLPGVQQPGCGVHTFQKKE